MPNEKTLPKMIAYYAVPNAYLTDHAESIRGLYDGFYFGAGTWHAGIPANIGLDGAPATNADWLPLAKRNVAALRAAGVTENLLTVSFQDHEPWPSPETLLSDEFTATMRRYFGALGKAAKETGFRGVCIDVEYPYPRYSLDHAIYTYDGYAPDDLLDAAGRQGRASMAAILDEFPDAVIFLLPGQLRSRPIERRYMLGLMDEMADRDAPGGIHFATEYAYCLHDPVTQAAIPRYEDTAMPDLLAPRTLAYWRRRGTMAPGVWPSHMVETGGEDYPKRPWKEELAELAQQMHILRPLAKRYVWSFSGQPLWVVPTPEIREKYGIGANYPGVEEFIPGWQAVLRDGMTYDRRPDADPRMLRLFDAVSRFDERTLSADGLCDAFGSPGRWWVLGPLGNPHIARERTAMEALRRPVNPRDVYYGLHGPVRWMPWESRDPRGTVSPRFLVDYLHTDDQSWHFTCWIDAPVALDARIQTGWDDGIVIRVGGEVVFDRAAYPPVGHGALYKDRYQFEACIPVPLPPGRTRIDVTTINAKGSWAWAMRVTDPDGYPFDGARFGLEP